jgi:hypothetical protein
MTTKQMKNHSKECLTGGIEINCSVCSVQVDIHDPWNNTIKPNHFVMLTSDGWVLRKQIDDHFFGGYKIFKAHSTTQIGKEWVYEIVKS